MIKGIGNKEMFLKRQDKIIAKKRIGTMRNIFKSLFFSLVTSLCILAQVNFAVAQTAGILAQGVTQFFDNNGNPLSLGTVTTYIPGTSTPKTTWQDAGETIPNTNPIILDIAGRTLLYGAGTYREVVKAQNGNLIWDAVTQPIGVTVNQTLIGDGQAVGTVKPWAAFIAPNQYAFAAGQTILRSSFPDLLAAITISTIGNCTSGSNIITGISDTSQIPAGAPIETSCVGSATVISKTSSSVTLSTPALSTVTTSIVFFPWGNGNGSTTFNVPDLRGVTLAGRPNMGGVDNGKLSSTYFGVNPDASGAVGGNQSTTLAQTNLPNINLNTYTPGTVALNTIAGSPIALWDGTVHNYSGGSGVTSPASDSGHMGQLNFTSLNVTVPSFTPSLGGSATPIPTIQPTVTINYIIKITPDINASTANGVASLGGMVGVIACGTGVTCSGNTVSITDCIIGALNCGQIITYTGNHAIQQSDCNTTLYLGGNTQFTLTFNAPGGYTYPCNIKLVNTDVYPGSGRGKILTVSGLSFNNPILYPGQVTDFTLNSTVTAWNETSNQRNLWKPSGNATFFADASAGISTNDGLASGAGGAIDTVNNAFNRLFNFVDYSGGVSQARLNIAGTFASGDILHMAGPLRGGAGNLQLLISATTGSPVMTASNGNPCIAVFDSAVISISGITCNAAGTNTFCWEAQDLTGHIFFETSPSTCIPGTGGAFFANSGTIQFDIGTNIGTSGGGTTGSLFNIETGGTIFFNAAVSISLLGSYTVTSDTVVTSDRSAINFGGSSFSLGGHTITGTRFACNYWSNIFGTSAAPNTFIPGNANGTVGSDCNAP